MFIIDIGFRDSIDLIESDFGIKCQMPGFLTKGQKQFDCETSNCSRLVTKIRWVVESFNGRLKQWRYLEKVLPNSQIPHIGHYTRLIAAISNKYQRKLNQGNEDADTLLW